MQLQLKVYRIKTATRDSSKDYSSNIVDYPSTIVNNNSDSGI